MICPSEISYYEFKQKLLLCKIPNAHSTTPRAAIGDSGSHVTFSQRFPASSIFRVGVGKGIRSQKQNLLQIPRDRQLMVTEWDNSQNESVTEGRLSTFGDSRPTRAWMPDVSYSCVMSRSWTLNGGWWWWYNTYVICDCVFGLDYKIANKLAINMKSKFWIEWTNKIMLLVNCLQRSLESFSGKRE